MTEFLEEYERPAVRPTFITVLCILTFIGSGWGIISESIKYFSASSQAASIAVTKEKVNSDLQQNKDSSEGARFAQKMVNSIATSPEKIRKGALANGGGAILCLAGAFMMWNLKRKGFYLYLAGTLIGIISPFVVFGSNNFIAILSSVVIGFIGLIFLILYGVNLKHMK